MKKVSIIIPVYNTASYLRKCLDSAKNQTYTNLEIICVDDGSTDGSEKIVDEYLDDERFVIIHKKNGGESSASVSYISFSIQSSQSMKPM